MADGQYRISQAIGQQYYSQYNNARQHLQRPTSPLPNHRRLFTSDTPSPSRSPGTRTTSNGPDSMYSQNHAGLNSHGMINGAGHQRFGNQMKLSNQYSQHSAHQHSQHGHGAQDGGHGAHQANFISHQHNQSGGAGGHFGTSSLHNGGQNNGYSNTNQAQTEHWKKQVEVAEQVRNLQHAHPHARNASSASKAQHPGLSNGGTKENEKGEARYRITSDWSDDEAEQSPWTEIDMGGSNLRCVSLQLFDYYPFLTKLFLNNNRLQSIPAEIGQLRNLVHLDLSLNQITVLPPEMGMLVKLRALLLVDNKIQEIPFELGYLCNLEMLAVDGNNTLNKSQLEIIIQDGPQELIRTLRENSPGPEPPATRDWMAFDEENDSPSDEKFKVATFNVLSKQAATPQQFGYTSSRALDWDYRKEIILEEIRIHDADIVCLQEMDGDNYHNLFRETLARNGYKGVYFQRPKAKTMTVEQIKSVDGCATFIKDNRYVILDKQIIEFPQVALARIDMKGQPDLYNRVMPRDNIGVVVFLENRDTGSRLIVVNTHLFWDQNYRDVKVVQATLLMEEVAKLAEKYAKHPPTPDKDKIRFRYANIDVEGEDAQEEEREPVPSMSYSSGTDIPMIVCGDFNSTPRSGVYELLTTGNLAGNHKDLGTYKYGDISKLGVHHPFGLKSSYGNIGELPFTNYTPGYTGTLDYIMYSTSSLNCTAVLGEIDPEYLRRVPGFPNVHFPSDHILLLSEFKGKPRKERKVTEVDFGPGKERHRG